MVYFEYKVDVFVTCCPASAVMALLLLPAIDFHSIPKGPFVYRFSS